MRIAGPRPPADDRIVIVALDDRTRREAPKLFHTRRGLAELFDAIAAGQPEAVGLDLFFAQPELELDGEVLALVKSAGAGRGGGARRRHGAGGRPRGARRGGRRDRSTPG